MANENNVTQTVIDVNDSFTRASQEAASRAKQKTGGPKRKRILKGKQDPKKPEIKKSSGENQPVGPDANAKGKTETTSKTEGTTTANSKGSQEQVSTSTSTPRTTQINTESNAMTSSQKIKLGGALMIGASLLAWVPLYKAGVIMAGMTGPLGALAASVLISAGATIAIVALAPKIIKKFKAGYAKFKEKRAIKKSLREKKIKNRLAFLQKAGVKLPKIKGQNGQALDWDNLNVFQKRKFNRFLKKNFKNGEFVKINASLVGGKNTDAAVVYKVGPDKKGFFHLYSPTSLKALDKNEMLVHKDKLTPDTYQEILTDEDKIADIISNDKWTEKIKGANGIVPETGAIKNGKESTETEDRQTHPDERIPFNKPKGKTRNTTKKQATVILPNGKKVKVDATGVLKPGQTYYADVKQIGAKRKITRKTANTKNTPKRKVSASKPKTTTQINISKSPITTIANNPKVQTITISYPAGTNLTISALPSETGAFNIPGTQIKPLPSDRLCVAQNIRAQDPNCTLTQTKLKSISHSKAASLQNQMDKAAAERQKTAMPSKPADNKPEPMAKTEVSEKQEEHKVEKPKTSLKVNTKKIAPKGKAAKNKKGPSFGRGREFR